MNPEEFVHCDVCNCKLELGEGIEIDEGQICEECYEKEPYKYAKAL
jgi:hypothetical protein